MLVDCGIDVTADVGELGVVIVLNPVHVPVAPDAGVLPANVVEAAQIV
jgi:hypothetical protein